MHADRMWMCFWPSLPKLWLQGNPGGLACAVLFAILVNLAIVSTFIWPEWLEFSHRVGLWLVTGSWWAISAWNSHNTATMTVALPKWKAGDTLSFACAQRHYLQRHWIEAETILKRMIKENAEDVEAHLLLASVLRRAERREEAERTLDHLATIPSAGKWELEIEQERKQLDDIRSVPTKNAQSSNLELN